VPQTGPYKLNVFVIAVLGVALCWWIYHFTDWFEAFASLLALGGIFSWLAFVAKVLPEARLKEMQDWVDSSVLTRRKLWLAFILIGAVLFVGALCVGTIEVQALPGDPYGFTRHRHRKRKNPPGSCFPLTAMRVS